MPLSSILGRDKAIIVMIHVAIESCAGALLRYRAQIGAQEMPRGRQVR